MSVLPAFLLTLGLSLLWLALSGHFSTPLLQAGAASALISAGLGLRFGAIAQDTARQSLFRSHRIILYWLWLIIEILRANRLALHAILRADPDIQPGIIKIHSRCRSPLARTVFANSITLTPGTVTLGVSGQEFLIHTLLPSLARPEAFTEMDRRVAHAFDQDKAS